MANGLATKRHQRLHSWKAVEQAIEQSLTASTEFLAPETIANVQDLVSACRRTCPIPQGAAKGYWRTIRIWWNNVEVEVFEDCYELYRFHERDTEIEHFERVPGSTFPVELLARLLSNPPVQD